MKERIPPFLLERTSPGQGARRGGLSLLLLDKAIAHVSEFIRTTYIQWDMASRRGLFQRLDPRIKTLFLLLFVVAVSLKKTLFSELVLAAFLMILVILSRLPLFQFYRRIFILGGLFGFLIPLPSALNIFIPGDLLFTLAEFSKPPAIAGYSLPQTIGPTREGLFGLLMLTSRVANSLSVTFLVLYTTPFPEIIRGLRVFRLPEMALIVMTLTYQYVFLFVNTVRDMCLAKKARYAGSERGEAARSWAAGRMAFFFIRSQVRFEDVYKAMVARGFSGTVRIASPGRLLPFDVFWGSFLLGAGILILLL